VYKSTLKYIGISKFEKCEAKPRGQNPSPSIVTAAVTRCKQAVIPGVCQGTPAKPVVSSACKSKGTEGSMQRSLLQRVPPGVFVGYKLYKPTRHVASNVLSVDIVIICVA
jgi:hypothetical protein